jgi:hypothetical protein
VTALRHRLVLPSEMLADMDKNEVEEAAVEWARDKSGFDEDVVREIVRAAYKVGRKAGYEQGWTEGLAVGQTTSFD